MSDSRKQIIRSEWVAPMDGPLIQNGAVVIQNGKILAVGSYMNLSVTHRDASVQYLCGTLLMPGLINAHTHLELSACQCGEPPTGGFVEWIGGIRARQPQIDVESAVKIGIEQCLKFGVTCVGDITQKIEASRRVLGESPLRAVSFGEVLGLGKLRGKFEELLPLAIDDKFESETLRIGLSPHAPYTVDLEGYKKCVQISRERSMPLATHLAETSDEKTFLESHAGPFRQLWNQLQSWSDDVETFNGSPIQMAKAIGLLELPAVLAHVNYCNDEELDLLSRGKASVVYCPRTHAYFGHPPHRWREMLARDINVAVGTDSCASSPDLNLVDELRLLRKIAPEIPAQTLWELGTIRAAKALSMDHQIGSLSVGKNADLVLFEVRRPEPLEQILSQQISPCGVWIDGVTAVHSPGSSRR